MLWKLKGKRGGRESEYRSVRESSEYQSRCEEENSVDDAFRRIRELVATATAGCDEDYHHHEQEVVMWTIMVYTACRYMYVRLNECSSQVMPSN